jgi:hypothetical protein
MDMDRKWQAPYFTLFSIALIIVMPVSGIAGLFLEGVPLSPLAVEVAVAMLAAVLIMVIVIVLFMRRSMKDIWSSMRRLSKTKLEELIAPLEEALRTAGFAPVLRQGRPPRPTWKIIDLKGGLNVTVVGQPGWYVLYVGPVSDNSRRDVERIEQVVDKALEGIEGT